MRVLLFDIDGTLLHTGGAGGAALRDAFCQEFAVPEAGDVCFSGRTDRAIGNSLFRLHGVEDNRVNGYSPACEPCCRRSPGATIWPWDF